MISSSIDHLSTLPGVEESGPVPEGRLVVVSNRVPPSSDVITEGKDGSKPVGGLVSAVKPAMDKSAGVWFGWSGKSAQRIPSAEPSISMFGKVEMATLDLSEDEISLYYTGFSNRTLWPLLHSFPERAVIRTDTHRAYRKINQCFAEALYSLLRPGDLVWVHDYHLFYVGQELRQMGWDGKIGFFLHVPFPPADIFAILPWSRQILEGLLNYDLVGVHTPRYIVNLVDTLLTELGGKFFNGIFTNEDRSTRLAYYNVGIQESIFRQPPPGTIPTLIEELSIPTSPDHRLILGVDRLDYTKGIPERLKAFERLFEHHPSLIGKVTFVQISSPSRTRVPEYIREKDQIERLVGQVNGRFSEGGWVPIRYLYRSYPQETLAQFYRDADVCLVTPLRDGMNLVAKEFIASQGDNPGVLVLSKFTGVASSMKDALIVNPYDIDCTAESIYQAVRMSQEERQKRCEALMNVVHGHTVKNWSDIFQSDLIRS